MVPCLILLNQSRNPSSATEFGPILIFKKNHQRTLKSLLEDLMAYNTYYIETLE